MHNADRKRQVFRMVGELLYSSQYISMCRARRRIHTRSMLDTLLIFRFHEGDILQEAVALLEVSRLAANRQASASAANQLTSRHRTRASTYPGLVSGIVLMLSEYLVVYRASEGGLRKPGEIFVARSTCCDGVEQVRDGFDSISQ